MSDNPLRIVASTPAAGSPGDLVADGVYALDTAGALLASAPDDQPDPRTGLGGMRKWVWGRRPPPPNVGWASPAALGNSPDVYVLRFDFDRETFLNVLSFELLAVPCNWSAWYLDLDRGAMLPLSDRKGHKLLGVTPTSSGQWVKYRFALPMVYTPLLELRLGRDVAKTRWPRDPKTHRLLAYRLGVRRLESKLNVNSPDTAPPDDENATYRHPFGTVERLVTKHWDASRALDGDLSTFWLSKPQPVARAVVPFYLDVRDAQGRAQVIDALRMVPMHPGPTMNIYTSSDNSLSNWRLSRSKVTATLAGPSSFMDHLGVLCAATNAALLIPSSGAVLDTSRRWSVGASYQPNYASTVAGSTRRVVLSMTDGTNEAYVAYDPSDDTFKLVVGGTVMVSTTAKTFAANDEMVVVAGYVSRTNDPDYGQGYYIAAAHSRQAISAQYAAGAAGSSWFATTFRGGNTAAGALPAQGYVRDVWVKQDAYFGPTASRFAARPEDYCRGLGAYDRTNVEWRGVLRARLRRGLMARVGPDDDYYESKEWTPVPRDYILRRGVVRIPPTKTKFLKLEFSALCSRPYPLAKNGTVARVRTHPAWIRDYHRKLWNQSSGAGTPPVYAPLTFEQQRVYPVSFNGRGGPRDPLRDLLERTTVGGIRDAGYGPVGGVADPGDVRDEHEFAAWRTRFHERGRHTYEFVMEPFTRQRAFFVGLREVTPLRRDMTAADDAPDCEEHMLDTTNLESTTGWTLGDGGAQATATGSPIVSKTMPAQSSFRSCQLSVRGSWWESQFPDGLISLLSYGHLLDVDGSALGTLTDWAVTTGQYVGSGGNTIMFSRHAGNGGDYGVRTAGGLFGVGVGAPYDEALPYDEAASYDSAYNLETAGARTSVAARILLPETNNGTYELRLWAGATLVARQAFDAAVGTWVEPQLGYIATSGQTDFRAGIVQTDAVVDEPFVVDMLGIWQNPLKVELSNDGGTTWVEALWPLGDPNGFLTFHAPGSSVKIKVTALHVGAWLHAWDVVPWYVDSPVVRRLPMDYNPPWGQSESEDLRATARKPMFRGWHRLFPRRYSKVTGKPMPMAGEGFQP